MTAVLKLVKNTKQYQAGAKAGEAKRPFRLWDAKAKAYLNWRFYAYALNAHKAAMIEAGWAEVGTTIEVVDVRDYSLLGQYTRRVNSVSFMR